MALRGEVEAKCPRGCGEMDAEVWSFVRGDKDLELKEALMAGELNLLICDECGQPFYADVPVVYADPKSELLVFSFPESFRKEEARWRRKMHEDYGEMRKLLSDDSSLAVEPELVFGIEPLRETLRADRDMEDEVLVAAHESKRLGLHMVAVERAYSREHGLPWGLPYKGKAAKGKAPPREAILKGLEALVDANDRLHGYARWLKRLEDGKDLPPLRL